MPRPPAIDTIDVRVERLVSGGAGLVHVGGRARFLDRVLPGELVRVGFDKGGKVAHLRMVEPSPLRRPSPCSHFESCGGCDWLHIPEAEQASFHRENVAALLARALGAPVDVEMREGSHALRYRTRARFRFAVQRGRAELGFLREGSHHLAPILDCQTLDEGLFRAARLVTDAIAKHASSGPALHGELSVARGARDGEARPVVDLRFEAEPPGALMTTLDELGRTELAGVRLSLPGSPIPIRFGDPRPIQTAVDGAPLVFPAGGFAQASDEGAVALARAVMELAAPKGLSVLELFAGSGTFSVALAKEAASFASVEIARDAVACAKENFAARGLTGKLSEGDADKATISPSIDLVVLDPPRQGARAAATAIAKARTRSVVYVSCDPTTLARDLEVLRGAGYGCERAIALTLFPQTSHVEVVTLLRRGRGRA